MNTQEQTPAVYNGCNRAAAVADAIFGNGCTGKEMAALSKLIASQTAAPAMYAALEAIQVILTPDATHCHTIIRNALAAARKGGAA